MKNFPADFGRFKYGDLFFYGAVEGKQIEQLQTAPYENFLTVSGGALHDLNELVILPPCEPSKIISLDINYLDNPWFLKAPSALSPHRSMIMIPFPEHETTAAALLGLVIGKKARRIKSSQAQEFVCGYTVGQEITDQTLAQISPSHRSMAGSYDTFNPIGPIIQRRYSADWEKITLFHNGKALETNDIETLLKQIPVLLEKITDAMTLWPGDLITISFPKTLTRIKPGDHLEVILPGLRPLATNVGMRGSA